MDIENTMKNKKEFKLLLLTYEIMSKGEFDSYYEGVNTYSKIKKFSNELANEDIKIWNNFIYSFEFYI